MFYAKIYTFEAIIWKRSKILYKFVIRMNN